MIQRARELQKLIILFPLVHSRPWHLYYYEQAKVDAKVEQKMPAVEPIQIILLSINLFVKDWFVGWLNGSLDARYSAIHSWHP